MLSPQKRKGAVLTDSTFTFCIENVEIIFNHQLNAAIPKNHQSLLPFGPLDF
jgi:hypothetical protein